MDNSIRMYETTARMFGLIVYISNRGVKEYMLGEGCFGFPNPFFPEPRIPYVKLNSSVLSILGSLQETSTNTLSEKLLSDEIVSLFRFGLEGS